MTWLGRLLGLIVALGGFAAAHVLVQTSSAQVPPVPTVSVTVPTVSVPTLPVPPPPTTTVPVPSAPTPTVPVPVPTVPVPPPATTAPPVQLPPVTVPPAPRPPATTTTGSTGSSGSTGSTGSSGTSGSSGSSQPSAPTTGTASPSPAGGTSSGSGSAVARPAGSAGSSASGRQGARKTTRMLDAKKHVARGRVSVRLGFTLRKADRVVLIIRGPAPSCRVAGYIPVRGRKGANTVVFAGRVHGHRLEPGVYLISLSPNRRLVPGAATEYVRVVSPRRSLPLPDRARNPSCNEAGAFAADPTAWILLGEALPKAAISRPTAKLAGAAVESPTVGDDGASGLLPDSGVLGAATGDADEGPFLTIAVLTLVAALLLTMLALVARFIRGTWNP